MQVFFILIKTHMVIIDIQNKGAFWPIAQKRAVALICLNHYLVSLAKMGIATPSATDGARRPQTTRRAL